MNRIRVLAHLPAANKLRAKIRAHTEPWLGPIAWPFPTWQVRRRPFDWMIDEADIPIPLAPPTWSLPERQRFNLYLRPAASAVR